MRRTLEYHRHFPLSLFIAPGERVGVRFPGLEPDFGRVGVGAGGKGGDVLPAVDSLA